MGLRSLILSHFELRVSYEVLIVHILNSGDVVVVDDLVGLLAELDQVPFFILA